MKAAPQRIGFRLVPLTVLLISLIAQNALAEDRRAQTVESSLKDLTARNNAALDSISTTPGAPADAMLGQPVDLTPEPRPSSDALVRNEVQSSLHRLRRESVSQQTTDGRKARVDDSLDRSAREP